MIKIFLITILLLPLTLLAQNKIIVPIGTGVATLTIDSIGGIGYSTNNARNRTRDSILNIVYPNITGATLQSIITAYAGKILQLPAGTLTITSNISVPANTTIIGAGKSATVIQLSGGATIGFSVASVNGVTISGLTIKGTYATPNVSGTSILNSITDVTTLNLIGTEKGISITGSSYNTTLQDIDFRNLSNSGLYVTQTSSAYLYSGSVTANNLTAFDCYAGFYFPDSGEYNKISNIHSLNCLIGIITIAGNLYLSNSLFNNCRVAFYAGQGGNDSHSSISNSAFNHCILYNIITDSTSKGLFFTGCETFQATTVISRTKGFSFDGGRLEGTVTVIDGGINTISNTIWYAPAITLTANTGYPNLQLSNCRQLSNGADVRQLGNASTSVSVIPMYNYVHNVGTATYTLPDVTKYSGDQFTISNMGSGVITVNSFSASQLWTTGVVSTMTIPVGTVTTFTNIGATFWKAN